MYSILNQLQNLSISPLSLSQQTQASIDRQDKLLDQFIATNNIKELNVIYENYIAGDHPIQYLSIANKPTKVLRKLERNYLIKSILESNL
jgi:hypothetical protein